MQSLGLRWVLSELTFIRSLHRSWRCQASSAPVDFSPQECVAGPALHVSQEAASQMRRSWLVFLEKWSLVDWRWMRTWVCVAVPVCAPPHLVKPVWWGGKAPRILNIQ